MRWDQGRSNSKVDLKVPQKEEFALKQWFLTFFRSLMLWESAKSYGFCLGKWHIYQATYIFRKFMDPHGSEIENATLKNERATGRTHDVVLGMSCCWVWGSFKNSWRPKIKTKQPFLKGTASTQSVATMGPQMKISLGVYTGNHKSSQIPSF